jgi:predicted lipid carrier protein YhbT
MLKNKLFYLVLRFGLFWMTKKNPSAAERLSEINGKVIVLDIINLKAKYFLLIKDKKIKLIPGQKHFDVFIKGKSSTFIGLLTHRLDADELFFTRKIHMEGDIETATYLKNILAHF